MQEKTVTIHLPAELLENVGNVSRTARIGIAMIVNNWTKEQAEAWECTRIRPTVGRPRKKITQ